MNRSFQGVLRLAVLAVVALPLSAFAADGPPFATFEIKVDNHPGLSDVSPVVTSPITKDTVAFHILNNTGRVLYFDHGSEKSYIPLTSNNTVEAPYAAGQEYKVVDGEGNTVASWHLDQAKIESANASSATASQFAEWESTLHRVIENQRVSYQEPPAKPEPHYDDKSSDTVRGFW